MTLTTPWIHCTAVACTAIFLTPLLSAQVTTDIGTGVTFNPPNQYPAPYGNQANGSRHQILVLASELNAAGMTAGDIVSLGFNVAVPSPTTLLGFTVSIGTTTATGLTNLWQPGMVPVWGPLDLTASVGWNMHPFDSPFTWDGLTNLLIETCFSNGFGSENSGMYRTATGFTSVSYRQTPNPNVCTFNGGMIVNSDQRPDLRFEWIPAEIPPVAAFSLSPAFTCDGVVQFTDASQYLPDTWTWDFGDLTGSSDASPEHTYLADGVYDVTLIVTNAFGSDTLTQFAAITVLTNGPRPDTACLPLSSPTIEGFGILDIELNGVALPSDDAVADGGYLDRSCILDTVEVGSLLDIAVTTGTIATHQIKVWVDWDSSGVFTADEVILDEAHGNFATASSIVPGTAVQNVPLRIRVMADYEVSPALDPCVGPQFGQAEDLALVIITNPDPPIAQFTASPLFSCDGQVQFTDGSLNLATGWTWDFGDLTGSTDASPQHTYLASGVYSVTLIAINANGGDTLTFTDLITVDLNGQLPAAQCTPQTQSYCCGYGLLGITFAGINSTSVDGAEGYQDRSCGQVAQVEEGSSYAIAMETDDQNDQDAYAWIDLDNDGVFAANELVFFALGTVDPSGTVAIPQGSVYNTPLRMRVITDVVGEITGPCDPPLFGQVEDFTAVVSQITTPPTAQFTATPETTCDGVVQFTDASTALPNSWLWDFGDLTTSTDQDPLHTYTTPGTYTVTLTASNVNGNDTEIQTGLIQYLEGFLCDSSIIPDNGQLVLDECQGLLVDDGGITDDYSPGVSGSVTLAPVGAETVTLLFDQFAFETNFDFLALYDGPSVNAPLLAELTGATVGDLPNGGVFTSSGPALTIRQEASNGPTTWEGFVAQWDCSFTGIGEAHDPIGSVGPVPASDVFNLNLTRGAGKDQWVTINNALGELMVRQALPQGVRSATFDAAPWPPGCYGLSVHGPDGIWSRLIVVQR